MEEHQVESKRKEILEVMRFDLGMRYRRITAASLHDNTPRSLVLRQQFAKEFLRQWQEGKRIINVDETWLGMTDFRRQKWRPAGGNNSVPKFQVVTRVSMILGVDTGGQVYLSLVQSNSNASVMGIFFGALVKKLEQEDKNWRRRTVLVIDNAPYHTCRSTMKILEDLNVPVLFTGPHSYSACPAELFFASFKSKDINPRHVPTGKR